MTGQSRGCGEQGLPPQSTAPSANVLMLHNKNALDYDNTNDDFELIPLTSPMRPAPVATPYEWPWNLTSGGETPGEGFVRQLAASTGQTWVEINVAETSHDMSYIKKGGLGRAYASSLYELSSIKALAAAQGKTVRVGAIFLVHGEGDSYLDTYSADVEQMYADYTADVFAITGQASPAKMVLSPQCSIPPTTYQVSKTTTVPWTLDAAHPERYVYAGATWQLPYVDGIHNNGPTYLKLGILAAKSWLRRASGFVGSLRPASVSLVGATLTIAMSVPSLPLEWDGSFALPHQVTWPQWAAGRGFEVVDAVGPVTITDAQIVGASVVLTLAAPPTLPVTVSHAMYQDDSGYLAGAPLGRHGQLRDSDTFSGAIAPVDGRNYLVQFSWQLT